MEEETESGFGLSLLSASSIAITQDGQWRFDNRKEAVCIMKILFRWKNNQCN
jgi:hypothetical protein